MFQIFLHHTSTALGQINPLFKICTFLLAISGYTVAGIPLRNLLHRQAQIIAQDRRLEKVDIYCIDGTCILYGSLPVSEPNWYNILNE
jgi:hypothetical protein